MPTFCRHGRFESSCAICRQEKSKAQPKAVTPKAKGTAARRPASSQRAAAPTRSRTVVTGRLERHGDDGFRSELLPGLRSSADALALAEGVLLAEARLSGHGQAHAGPWSPLAQLMGDPEAAFVQALLVALAGPCSTAGSVATAEALAARGSGASATAIAGDAELAALLSAGPLGPRAHGVEPAGLAAAEQLAQRAGGTLAAALQGETGWSPQRRFARLFDRLALKGVPRAVRIDLLTALGRAGVLDARAGALHLGSDQVTAAAKRVFAVADVALLERRAATLADAAGIELDALELALWNLAGADATGAGAAARWSTAQPATDLGLAGTVEPGDAEALAELMQA